MPPYRSIAAIDYARASTLMNDEPAELYNKINLPKYHCEKYDDPVEGDSLFVGKLYFARTYHD